MWMTVHLNTWHTLHIIYTLHTIYYSVDCILYTRTIACTIYHTQHSVHGPTYSRLHIIIWCVYIYICICIHIYKYTFSILLAFISLSRFISRRHGVHTVRKPQDLSPCQKASRQWEKQVLYMYICIVYTYTLCLSHGTCFISCSTICS